MFTIYFKAINHKNSKLSPLRRQASPDPPATSSAPMYRVHDHRQTHADKVSLKMDRNIYNNLYNKTHTSRNFILWSHLTWPPTCNPHFTSLIENLKISLLPTYKPPFVEHMREHSLF